jgi:hypothetical protein
MLDVLDKLWASRPRPAWPEADHETRLASIAAAGRQAGRRPLALTDLELAQLRAAGVDWPICERTDELWRITILLSEPSVHLLTDVFRGGDSDERIAVLRALPLLPEPETYRALAAEACRTNVVPVFAALASRNPFPARHMPDDAFAQLCLKAIFLGVPLSQLIDLHTRLTPELERMAGDFAAERRAAGRPVPDDLRLLVRPQERA